MPIAPLRPLRLAVVVISYEGKGLLAKFLPSLIAHSEDAELIVIDNASTDGTATWLADTYPAIRLIRLAVNTGFAGGYNLGLARLAAEGHSHYLLINSDVEVQPGWLAPLLPYTQRAGVAHAQPTHFEYSGAAGGYIDQLGFPFCRGRVFDTVEADAGQYADARQVFWASGACCLVRADAFHTLGGFEAGFYAHMEEIDLCWRLRQAGYESGLSLRARCGTWGAT
jgi:GT2 family glycosyltransferase